MMEVKNSEILEKLVEDQVKGLGDKADGYLDFLARLPNSVVIHVADDDDDLSSEFVGFFEAGMKLQAKCVLDEKIFYARVWVAGDGGPDGFAHVFVVAKDETDLKRDVNETYVIYT